MNILLINGSPRKDGCTKECLLYLKKEFKISDNACCQIIDIPNNIQHCTNCRVCKDKQVPCIKDAFIKMMAEQIQSADGIVIGCSVYYYGITSQLQAFLTRLCYSCPHILEHKLCSFFSVSRRSGNTDCFNQVMKIFQMHNAVMVGGNYVNEVYGDNPNEIYYDKEGLQSLRFIVNNFLTMIPLLKEATFNNEEKVHTNFVSREFLEYKRKEKEQEDRARLIIERYD